MLGSDDVKRVDFSSVIKILLSYRSLSESFSQGEFIAELSVHSMKRATLPQTTDRSAAG